MPGIVNQQSSVNLQETKQAVVEQQVAKPQVTKPQVTKPQVAKQEDSSKPQAQKITSAEEVQDLVNRLNDAVAPINTNLRFGVDSQNVFFVSVIESQTDKLIRRFPAEEALNFLPKIQEVSGLLFDTRG